MTKPGCWLMLIVAATVSRVVNAGVFFVTMPLPSGLVSTHIDNTVLRVGDVSVDLPHTVVGVPAVTKTRGTLVFAFETTDELNVVQI
tara:strand:+ start:2053 stop:2313 length:261 start_codon:yes stop_codon:yes gene_type:complete